jgi:two-component system cell cycle sensor histidine kinase/response regulator CckA
MATLLGVSLGACSAEDFWARSIHPEDRDEVLRSCAAATARGEDHELEYRMVASDGRIVWVHDLVSVVREEGAAACLRGFLIDITARRRLETELRHAQKMEAVGRLAGGIAHDYNNLLMAILGYAELLRAGADATRAREHVDQILRSARRAAALTQQLLAFSRKQVLQPRVIDLNAVVTDLLALLRRLLGESIGVECRLAPGIGPVRADPAQMGQVILNLALNARDAMPDGGRLVIETRGVEGGTPEAPGRAGSFVMLSVSDTGMARDADARARLFDPGRSESPQGGGAWPAAPLAVVEQTGGFVTVESREGGTTIRLHLPRVAEAAEVAAAGLSAAAPGGAETVLLVEDEDGVRDLMRESLEHRGYVVLAASDGHEALRTSESHHGSIDLLITDLVMPRMGGRDLARRLAFTRPGIRVIFMSGYGAVEPDPQGPSSETITKPFALDVLSRRVRDLLDSRPPSL